MITHMAAFIRKLDQFGVVFQPNLTFTYKQYKTVLGGLMSIILYGLSFGFFIYNIVQWQSGQMLPKITTSQNIISYEQYNINDMIVSFSLRTQEGQSVDPFDHNAVILQPVLLQFTNGMPPKIIKSMEYNKSEAGFYEVSLKNLTFSISQDKTTEKPEIEYFLTFGECLQAILPNGYNCATKEERDLYFNQTLNAFTIQTYIKQYSTKEKAIETIKKEIHIAFNNLTTFYAQNALKSSKTTIDDGFLFENLNKQTYTIDVETLTQTMDLSYFYKVFGYPIYIIYNIKMGSLQQEQTIQFAKISEVLANTGSIVSVLLLLQYIVIIANQQFLSEEAINSVIQMYYPKWKDLVVKRNIFGRIKQVQIGEKDVNVKWFEGYYGKLEQIAYQKLSIANQIYEISRLQMVLHTLVNRDFIKVSHRVGIKLKMQLLNDEEPQSQNPLINNVKIIPQQSEEIHTIQTPPQEESVDDKLMLTDDDFQLLLSNDPEFELIQLNDIQQRFYMLNN